MKLLEGRKRRERAQINSKTKNKKKKTFRIKNVCRHSLNKQEEIEIQVLINF